MEKKEIEMIFGNYHAYKVTDNTWVISFMNGSQMLFLLEGEESALLIDTGYAVGNLRKFVTKLTDKNIIVTNTHYHPDHAAGNGEWERVLVSHNYEIDKNSLKRTVGNIDELPFPNYEHVLIKDGDTIELGNRTIKVIEGKNAHCNSHLYFLDEENRMIFLGDEMDSWQVILFENSFNPEIEKTYSTREALLNFKDNMIMVKSMSDKFDYMFGNHNGSPLAKSYLDDFIELIDSIFGGTAVIDEKLNHPFIEMDPRAASFGRIRHKKASILTNRADAQEIIDGAKK